MNLTFLAAPSFDMMNSTFWMFTTFIVGIVAVIGFLVYRYYLEPPICRQLMAAKWKQGTPAFIQDNAGVVHFTMSDKDLPEGVVHNKRGWFLLSRAPYIPDISHQQQQQAQMPVKRGPGRPPKSKVQSELQEEQPPTVEQENEALATILQVPILAGFGKAVFFGYDGAPLLGNLKTLCHADLRVMKEIIPATISRTQLSNLVKWAMQKGYEKRGGDQTKFLVLCVGIAAVLGSLGLVVYLILNGGKPA